MVDSYEEESIITALNNELLSLCSNRQKISPFCVRLHIFTSRTVAILRTVKEIPRIYIGS